MEANTPDRPKHKSPSLYVKSSVLGLFLILSILVVACGAANNNQNSQSAKSPQVTVTIRFNNDGSPVPTAPPFACGAWITNSTPGFVPGAQIAVNMKFVKRVDDSPQGIANAQAVVTMTWADGTSVSSTVQTQSDGLAVAFFTIPNQPAIINKNSQATVQFTAPDGTTCSVDQDRAAFMTIILPSPTSAVPSPSATQQGQPGQPTPGQTPMPGQTPTVEATTPPFPFPTVTISVPPPQTNNP